MFACFFSFNQCLSHSWIYFSCPLIFQKLQSRHQHISFPHFFVYSGDIQFVLPLTFIYLSLRFFFYLPLPSFLSICLTFFFIYLYLLLYQSLPSFLSNSPSFLSVSTFYYIYLYLLFTWKIIFLFNHNLLVFSNYYGLQMDFW